MAAEGMLWLIPALPFVGFLVNGLVGRRLPKALVSTIGCGVVGASFALAIAQVWRLAQLPAEERLIEETVYQWFAAGAFSVDVSFQLDPLSAVMILVVTGVGFLIHVYSTAYMSHDPAFARFFTYLNLFTFAMLLLVLGGNFLLLFVGWEGVGLCSYLLIGFWYERQSASDAGKKAFIVNRIGDVGFAIALLWIVALFGSLDYSEVFPRAGEVLPYGGAVATAITLLLFVGATGKSAQVPLYVWLPDAMEGPTPVSALIHAATMVTAGVYMVVRAGALFVLAPTTLLVIAVVGAATALFAATIGLVQNDIKKVLAYSTVSQLGYMFLALGVGAFSAGIFHLFTHAFFKACLFLGAGSVIHAMSDEQDMRKMGGLKSHMPLTFWTFAISTVAIAGIPPLAGFVSKDEILWKALSTHHYALWAVGLVAAGCTAFYMFRLLFMTFSGECRADEETRHHLHESPPAMTAPLLILALLAAVAGALGWPHFLGGSNAFHHWLEPVLAVPPVEVHASHSTALEWGAMVLSVAVAAGGIALAWRWYAAPGPLWERPARAARRFKAVYETLLSKYYVDEIYHALIVRPIHVLSRDGLWKTVDALVIDGIFVMGWGVVTTAFGRGLRYLQAGRIQVYAGYMVLGLIVMGLLLWK